MDPIVSVLESHGATVPIGYGWRKMRCPYHDDRHPSASVNIDYGRFVCFVCDLNQDAMGLLMEREGVRYGEAKRRVDEIVERGGGPIRGSTTAGLLLFGQSRDQCRRRQRVPAWRRVGARTWA